MLKLRSPVRPVTAALLALALAACATGPAAIPAPEGGYDKASDIVLTAINFLGVRYARGGADASAGFDCSGFTRHVVQASLGLLLPRSADEQAHAPGLVSVEPDRLEPGDLVFFNTLKRRFSHVGIYVGDGKFIHAPRPGGAVRMEDMRFAYWKTRFTGARRAAETTRTAPDAFPESAMF
ncbi:C40 family peptidase [Piscinibacter sp.]|uniref:C40 family peptidase n=1 Tax=Piscinibacter sp. TaxID=1903157 RepID=UPI002BE7FCF3|nr:C40 family peptidase [Albitalea sp.]HUG25146.1 C40 family peptidase [Albitalea sp.]